MADLPTRASDTIAATAPVTVGIAFKPSALATAVAGSAAFLAVGSWLLLDNVWLVQPAERDYEMGLWAVMCMGLGVYLLGLCCATMMAYWRAGFGVRQCGRWLSHFAAGQMAWSGITSIEPEERVHTHERRYFFFFKSTTEYRSQHIRIRLTPTAYEALKAQTGWLDRLCMSAAVSYDDARRTLVIHCNMLNASPSRLLKMFRRQARAAGLRASAGGSEN